MSEQYFSADFLAAQSRFRKAAAHAGLESLPIDAKGPNGEDLSIDIARMGPRSPRKALIHSSGLHGVEGFAGSAIQLQLLDHPPVLAADTAIVVVHILNPFGMSWLRRVNSNNVDLNRNCLEGEPYQGAPEAYAALDSLLNPKSPPSNDRFALRAIWPILRFGMPALRQAIAGGQYEFPKGLFFGGKQLQPEMTEYRRFLATTLTSAERVIAIDVHTGLGKRAEDTLLVDPKHYEARRRQFGERVAPLNPQRGPAYRVRGDFQWLINHVFSGADVGFVGQEFGTYNSIQVLSALRQENRWHHYGTGTLDHPTKRNLREVFCPDDPRWRDAVLVRGRDLISQAITVLTQEGDRI
jgi:hypothetical protein